MAAATGVENRALTPLGARTMLDYVVSALREAPSVGTDLCRRGGPGG